MTSNRESQITQLHDVTKQRHLLGQVCWNMTLSFEDPARAYTHAINRQPLTHQARISKPGWKKWYWRTAEYKQVHTSYKSEIKTSQDAQKKPRQTYGRSYTTSTIETESRKWQGKKEKTRHATHKNLSEYNSCKQAARKFNATTNGATTASMRK